MVRATAPSARLASLCAAGAGIAWISWAVLNASTHGALDAGSTNIGMRVARAGALLMVAWNVLLLPAAVHLGARFEDEAPERARIVTVAGIASLLFWAYGGATRGITPALEVTYIALSAVWWIGIGMLVRREHPAFGAFTVVVGVFAAWDAVLTTLEPVPFSLYLTASPKLPLSIAWDFWVAWVLLGSRLPVRAAVVPDVA